MRANPQIRSPRSLRGASQPSPHFVGQMRGGPMRGGSACFAILS